MKIDCDRQYITNIYFYRLCPLFKPYLEAIQKDLEDKKQQEWVSLVFVNSSS